MKKVFIIFSLFIFICSTKCFAASNVIIQNTNSEQVLQYIINKAVSQGYGNYAIESATSNSITLTASSDLENILGIKVGVQQDKIIFTAVQNGNNTLLSANIVIYQYDNNGYQTVHPVNDNEDEITLLNNIKAYFNNYYFFGYITGSEVEQGGFKITSLTDNGVFKEAGVKVGDIILRVNGEKVKKHKRAFLLNNFPNMFSPKPATFVIKTGKIEKEIVITPKEYLPLGYMYNN